MKQLFICLFAILFSVYGFSQSTIKGRITDDKGQPIEGITVKEKGSSNGTITDKDGNYTITLKNDNNNLVFSGIGVSETERPSRGRTSLDVTLQSTTTNLGGIEIVGTRSLRRSATETAVPVDIIPVSRILNTLGQVDINQILQFVAPSFNSNRQSGQMGQITLTRQHFVA